MFRKLLIVLALLCSPANAQDQAQVSQAARVYNHTGQQCIFSSLETLDRYHGDTKLAGLVSDPRCQVANSLDYALYIIWQKGVGYEARWKGPQDHAFIEKAMREHRGVAFGTIRAHCMVLTHYDAKNGFVHFIDNGDPQLLTRRWTMQQFTQEWDGMAIVIYPFPAAPESKSSTAPQATAIK